MGRTRNRFILRRRPLPLAPLLALLALAVPLVPKRASAFDYDIDGFTRFTLHYHDDLPLSPAGLPTQEEFADMRVLVVPRVHLGEDLIVALRIDALDGVVAGDGQDELDVLAGVDSAVGNARRDDVELDSIDLDRAWLEYTSPAGLLRVGRQSADWGLGLVHNGGGDRIEWGLDGNGPGRGDTFDRVSFITDLFQWLGFARDHLLVGAAYDRVHEGDIFVRADDVSQFVLTALYTNGTIRPRAVGTREAGLYTFYVMNKDAHSDVGVIDVYGRLELGPERYGVYGEMEAAWGIGSADRRGLVSDSLLDLAEQTASAAFTEALTAAGLDSAAAGARGAEIAAHGTDSATERAAVAPALARELADEGWSAGSAGSVADRIALEGVRSLADDEITVQTVGGIVRGGVRIGAVHAGLEVGGTGALSGDDVTPALVGPFTANRIESVNQAIGEVLGARQLEAALTGRRATRFAFDRELDPALILFDEVGPLGPDGRPTVANAFYLKLFGELELTESWNLFGLAIYGQLGKGFPRFRIECGGPADCRQELIAEVVPAGSADELGVEVDGGVTYHANEYLSVEARVGYLIAGHAFGPDASDVLAGRVQIGVEW